MKLIFANDKIIDFIDGMDRKIIQRIHQMLKRLREYGYELRMPHSKPIGDGLFELRILGKKQVRIIYAFDNNTAVLLHIFIKRTWSISSKELRYAMEVWKNYLA
jgi:phage-related protein